MNKIIKKILVITFAFHLLFLQTLFADSGDKQIENFSGEQLIKDFSFFKGDSLAGYDFIKDYKTALEVEHINMISELKAFFYLNESTFVKNKFGINEEQLPRKKIAALRRIVSTACNNLDFENGDYTGWIGNVGYNANSAAPFINSGTATGPSMSPYTDGINQPTSDCNYFSLINASYGNDPYGNFPGLDSGGGNWSERLGGDHVNLYNGYCALPTQNALYSSSESLEQTIMVTPSNSLITYKYAVVLNDGGHAAGAQPYFYVEILDQLGNLLPACVQFYQECTSGIPPSGYFTSALHGVDGFSPVFYQPWAQNIIDLTPWLGQSITIRFTASGCAFGGHFGFAYIDLICGGSSIAIAGNLTCNSSGIDTLTAPSVNGASYSWTGPGIVGSNATQTILINAIGTYSVTIYPPVGCGSYTISVNVTGTLVSFVNSTTDVDCNGGNTGSAGVSAFSGTPPYTYAWNTTPVQTSATATGLSAGNYTVQITDSTGFCTATQPVIITEPSALSLSTTVTQPTCISCTDGIISFTPGGGTTPYTYALSPAFGNLTGTSYINIASGHYYLCMIDADNCQLCDSVIVPENTTGISVIRNNGSVTLSPNPVTHGTELKLNFIPRDNTSMRIYDAVGKMVSEIKINSMNTFIERSALPAGGIYFWHLMTGDTDIARGKLIVLD